MGEEFLEEVIEGAIEWAVATVAVWLIWSLFDD